MLRSKALILALLLFALPLAVQAGPPPTCTCELCIADPGVQCSTKGSSSCADLLRSGVCLGLFTERAALGAEEICTSPATPELPQPTPAADADQVAPAPEPAAPLAP